MKSKQEKRWEAAVAAMQALAPFPSSNNGTPKERRVTLVDSAFAIANAMVEEDEKYGK